MRGVVGSGEPAIVIYRNSTFRSGPQGGKIETETNRRIEASSSSSSRSSNICYSVSLREENERWNAMLISTMVWHLFLRYGILCYEL